MTDDVVARYGLRRLINASGTETVHGASRVPAEVTADMAAILPHWVEIAELQQVASGVIADLTGAEAGCVTGCSAAGIAISVAACMTGADLAKVQQLPDTAGLRDQVVMQKGHDCDFGAPITQMVRLTGARVVEVGRATACARLHLEAALGERIAAGLFVISHHTVQSGLVDLATFCQVCHARGVPVIVDAAAEYDWPGHLAAGADLVIFSSQKAPAGPTAGVIAGRADLIQACLFTERGIGRPMKAGKEAIVGALAALTRWRSIDWAAEATAIERRLAVAERRLASGAGLRVRRVADPTGNPFARLEIEVDPAGAGWTAYQLAMRLLRGDPAILLRRLHADRGLLLMDVRRIEDGELDLVCTRIAALLSEPPADSDRLATATHGDTMARLLARSGPAAGVDGPVAGA